MKITLAGTRGSIGRAGPETVRYGGDTSSIKLETDDGALIILDAGSGIRELGPDALTYDRVDILLTHLHMDHVQGLPFFIPLLDPKVAVTIWGPVSTTQNLRSRITKYLSPPLFPVRVRELANVEFRDVPPGQFVLDGLKITADLVSHPGETLGYRLDEGDVSVAYMPDHEPALGSTAFPDAAAWTSGFDIAHGVDVLIHDAQYTDAEYESRVGWGHISHTQLLQYAAHTGVDRLVTFHHDPSHTDDELDQIHESLATGADGFEVVPGKTELTLDL